MKRISLAFMVWGLACSAPGKPIVEMPSVDSDLQAEIVAEVSAADGMEEVRSLRVDGERLYIAAGFRF